MESFQIEPIATSIRTHRVNTPQTVAQFLHDLQLETKYFVILVNGRSAQLTDRITPEMEVTILPRIAGGARGAKRKVKTKEKKPKTPRNKNKSPMWTIEGEKVIRVRKFCPKCGPGTFLAEHYDRHHCGNCGYTIFKRSGKPSAPIRRAPDEDDLEASDDS